jgi:outer membrane protein OmpA-like peptidoglycan-associated protein
MKGDPSSNDESSNPRAALGLPNWQSDGDGRALTLGCNGSVVLEFEDNALVDVEGPDLYVFEIGVGVESTLLSISETGETWLDLGRIEGATAAVDIAQFTTDRSAEYRYVRLTDAATGCTGRYPGADIDAVAAIGAVARPPINETTEIVAELTTERRVDLDIQFEFNSDVPTQAGFEKIAAFAAAIGQLFDEIPDLTLFGHTDAVGSDAYNLALSQRRADSVRGILIQLHGFPAQRLTAQGLGETALKFPNSPEADGNRRVEVRLSDDAHFPVAAPVPAHRDAEEHFPTALHGSYAPDGDCARWPRATVAQGHVEFYGWEGGDILFLDQWRACPDCLPEYPLAASELRIAPVIAEGDPKAAPVFRFNANGVPGLMLAEGGGDMTKFPELAAVVDFGVLARCDVSRIEAAATLDPTAEASWRSFENDSRAGASYCPVLDNTAQNQMCFDLGCGFGRRIDWALGIMGSPAGFTPPRDSAIEAEIVIDNSVVGRMTFTRPDDDPNAQFYAPFDFETHGITLVQLQNGREAELRLSAEGQTAAVLMGLRGSSRALDGIMQMCGERLMAANPINRPDRFLSQQGASQPEAERLAREALAATLAEMNTQATPPIVDVQTAWLIDLGDGWRFILTDVGPSNFHFGMGGYGGFVLASPPGEPFRRVGPDANASIIWIDQEQRNMGWPRLLFQSARGVNPPFHAWRWNGQNYIYDREIQQ